MCVRIIGPAVLIAATLGSFADPDYSWNWAGLPFLISWFVIGLPHGALDFRLTFLNSQPATGPDRKIIAIIYVAGMLLSLILLLVVPILFVSVFFAVTAIHFGERDRERVKSSHSLFDDSAIGLLVLSLPAFFHAAEYGEAVRGLSFTTGSDGLLGPIPDGTWLGVGTIGLAAAAIVLFRAMLRRDLRIFDIIEVGVVLTAAAVLHPLFFIGLFFLSWHSVRHLSHFCSGPLNSSAMMRLHADALVLAVPSWIAVCLVAGIAGYPFGSVGYCYLIVAFYGIVSPSHHVLVARNLIRARKTQRVARIDERDDRVASSHALT
ncbi:Brp/Blh family beta-carotene 15,15'-dioxygenase [Stratiformator vulcanicus]|uniref:Probable beta-carotene 15,15'-dioxygenase n=1 Tax=Stratiformator vulcanicus TaxID=2527980 RepID=A0A517QXB6_9PLAN|nr:Brp/Blh family beta-carotene 15,15'-dioxygenase [Stratiformator vulcanicus]QDT36302.1 hypothetical protein Pan189_06580 [Stratiformator vulcanicus]